MDYLQLFLFLLLAAHSSTSAQEIARGKVVVDGGKAVAETSENFICATIDWWPHDKCNYDQCPWGYSSIINLNLSHPILGKAIKAFGHLRIRIGGSLQDQILYDVPSLKSPCHPFFKKSDGLFGFSTGCLHMQRWDAVNHLFMENGILLTFGLNALYGRHKSKTIEWVGDWDPSNAIDLIKYTISKGYKIDSWELGNELCGGGVAARVNPVQYGKDLIQLRKIINQLYESSESKPSVLAPGGFFDKDWFTKMLQTTEPGVVNGLTHHIYNLGAGNDPDLEKKMQNPNVLDNTRDKFDDLHGVIEQYGPWTSAWVGESGGAYNSGGRHVSDAFINSFWYLDQLGMSATYNTKTLIGGNYGLIDKDTFVPNPDFYRQPFWFTVIKRHSSSLYSFMMCSALLWDKLMGKNVLSIATDASPFLRSYGHCLKGKDGIALLFINLSNQTSFTLDISSSTNKDYPIEDGETYTKKTGFIHGLHRAFSWTGSKVELNREEYHLTPRNGDLRSQTMVLNGRPLVLSDEGDIPMIEPVSVDAESPLYISPSSIAFIVIPSFDAPACR
ncbi:hypothetical protein V2J09_014930 [Rumex salicifolius]